MQSPPMQDPNQGAAQAPAAQGLVQGAAPEQGPPQQDYPIPPNVQGAAIPVGGGYCFGGPHPAPGGGWEASPNPHVHNYAPFDLRLFAYHNGCYYFIGDPRDFGYTGQSYSYYGAHPVADEYGGGWCFMVGPHSHWWRPWSPSFTVVGPWYYWNGPYNPFFWAYWPFYSFYYRSYYPSFYAGGRYFRGGFRAAPPITRVPASAGAGWRGGASWRGAPAGGAWRGAPAAGGGPGVAARWRLPTAAAGVGRRRSPTPGRAAAVAPSEAAVASTAAAASTSTAADNGGRARPLQARGIRRPAAPRAAVSCSRSGRSCRRRRTRDNGRSRAPGGD